MERKKKRGWCEEGRLRREEKKKTGTGEQNEKRRRNDPKWECRIMDHGLRWGRVITVPHCSIDRNNGRFLFASTP